MVISTTLIIIAVVIVAIWIIIEAKRMKHKIFAIFLIALILFTYLSFTIVMRNHDVDLKTPSGMYEGVKLYFSWLVSILGNFKEITAHAINLDWSGDNETQT